ncbi:MAG TPA: efflux RND transporter periplasmic adaptor subunit [Bryobacteraceae bacterium]|jgi:RND family efflux transporter MFP subunit|nr:efflux RND transporter periplasmic adaptor subunit [Bryobacteraceae bacterium]
MSSVEQENFHAPGPEPESPPRLSKRWRIFLGVLGVLAGAALCIAIYHGIESRVRADSELKRETAEISTQTVSVIHPKAGALSDEVVLPGNIQAFVATPIYARTSGYLKKWYFDIGAHVKTGQLLAEIETPEIDRQLDQARADLATAQANLDLSQTTAARYQALIQTESVARQDLEDKLGDLQAKKAMVDSAKFNVRRLEETQRFQKVYAPFDGVITARNIDTGALIDAGANSPGKELFDLAATQRLRVYVNVPQADLSAAKPGTLADLTLAEMPGRHFQGKIVRNAAAIDPASRTLLTEVDVNNPTGELLPGAYVSVHLKLGARQNGVVLPVNTLIFRSEGLRVAVVRDGKAELVAITMGRDFGTEVEVVAGVNPGDAVIENPSDSLSSGTPVRAVPARPQEVEK